MENIHNSLLSELREYFKFINKNEIIDTYKLPINKAFDQYRGNVGWAQIKNAAAPVDWGRLFPDEIETLLRNSVLNKYPSIYIQIGYGEPTYSINPKKIIPYFEELLHVSVQGFPVITPDAKYIMEVIYTPKLIYSNFL